MSYSISMTATERDEFSNARQVFSDLLDDFRAQGLLRKGTPKDQRSRLSRMWSQSRQFGQAFNAIFKIFDTAEQVKAFAVRNKVDGIDEEVLTGSLLNQAIGVFLYDIETLFKTSLLFFLVEKQGLKRRMEIGPLVNTIISISPAVGPKLKPLIDLELRNALAHGAFWFESGGEVYMAENSYLDNPKNLKFYQFLIRTKRQNIVAHAFIDTLVEKVNQGYFT